MDNATVQVRYRVYAFEIDENGVMRLREPWYQVPEHYLEEPYSPDGYNSISEAIEAMSKHGASDTLTIIPVCEVESHWL